MFLAYMYYKYHEKWGNFFRRKRLQYANKYKRRWINRFNPESIIYQTAIDAAYYRPERLTQEDAEKIGKAFIKADKQLEHGFSK